MSFFSELSPEMDAYLEQHSSNEPELLQKLREETFRDIPHAHMISGIYQGRFLSVISKILAPKRILELGTFTGYATLCLAEGLAINGKITTLDTNEELIYLQQKYFGQSAYAQQIECLLEDARQYLQNSTEIFDLVFIDANKTAYADYFNLIKPRLQKGSVVLFDNVLWYGKVLENQSKSKMTKTIKKLNEIVAQDEDFDSVILPLRDGISMLRKNK